MLKQTANFNPNRAAETLLAASRQVWLAGLGTAAISRDWAQHRASDVLKGLVKQGSVVESKAIRIIGSRVETSIATAEALWNQARRTVMSTVSAVAENAAAAMPRLNGAATERAPAKSSRKVAKVSKAVKPGRRIKRAAKRAK
jgi:Poly(hydroxyalcanoate) granule associated protein (phasin)